MKSIFCCLLISIVGMQLLADDNTAAYLNRTNTLYFEENKGQWHDNVQYRLTLPAARLFLEKNRFTYLLVDSEALEEARHCHTESNCIDRRFGVHAFRMNFWGALPTTRLTSSCPSATYNNYFIGNNPQHWAGNVQLFAEVRYHNLYQGIDMRVSGSDLSPKYDLIVKPQASPQLIQLQYEGAQVSLQANGDLMITTSIQKIIEKAPIAYQYIDQQMVQVPCRFVVQNNTVSFQFPKAYNPKYELIIDPTLIFASFTGSFADNWGFTATYDSAGNLYAGGIVFDIGYPTTTGAFDASFNGPSGIFEIGMDISIAKFSSNGSNLLYSTYLGGSNSSEFPHSLIVDPVNSELIMLGTTGSSNYPIKTGCFDTSFNGGTSTDVDGYVNLEDGCDIVLTRFSANGSTLVGSTFLGGTKNDGLNQSNLRINYADDSRGEVFLDSSGNIYVATCTRSNNMPITPSAAQSTLSGDQEAYVAKFNSDLTTLLAATYLGGSEDDAAYSIKIDGSGKVFVCGGTHSSNFPTTAGTYDNSYNGGISDGFIARYNNTLTSMERATLLGTNEYDQSYFLDLDDEDFVLTVGQTEGDYPISPNVYSNANSGLYIQKFNNDLTNSIWSTTIGNGNGHPNITPSAFLVDICNRIYVSGWGGAVNSTVQGSTTLGMPTTSDAFQASTDGSDFYLMALDENADELVYATFFGGSGIDEHVDGGTSRFDKQGIVYQAICGGCGGQSQMPTTSSAWSQTNNSNNCNLAAVKFDFDIAPTFAALYANPATTGCAPFTVQFNNASSNAVEYFWDLGNGTTTTETSPTVTYTETGNYEVMLIARNLETCNIADTTYTTISVVDPLSFSADFTLNIDCFNLNVSANPVEPTNAHIWIYSDGFTTNDVAGFHTLPSVGDYTITHIINSTVVGCPATDTVTQSFTILPSVNAGFVVDTTRGCIPYTVTLNNQSVNTTDYIWNFGNGQTSTEPNPTVTYPTPGSYTISLIANNPNSCNLTDTATLLVIALDTIVTAQFTETLPNICDPPLVAFSSTSGDGLDYSWFFGDGTSDIGTNATPTHLYPAPGTYNVTLIVDSPCADPDTMQRSLTILPPPLVDATLSVTPDSGCPPLDVSMTATGNATIYLWDLGDGTTATGTNVSHQYTNSGSYTITLNAIDSTTCNIVDISTATIEVYVFAHADFSMNTDTIEATDPVDFTNLSTNATSYLWNFGDGTTSTDTNPQHTYTIAGTYTVCLTAMNEQHCDDDTCQIVTVIPRIYTGIPNVFSPNNDQLNDILYVEGRAGISVMDLRIYNRWGELVFETTDPQAGWDGTYKGVQQEIDSYAYIFSATLVSGRTIKGQGNVTIMR
jgi:gliding motility-associated-like protein